MSQGDTHTVEHAERMIELAARIKNIKRHNRLYE